MSKELAQALFERDLSEAEADALEASLEASPEAAEALFAAAEARYRATGLPAPRWDERSGPGRSRALWLAALLGLGLAAGAGVFSFGQHGPALSYVQEDERALPLQALPSVSLVVEHPDADAAPASVPGPSRQGQRLGVVLRLREETLLTVTVLDQGQATRRRLFNGTLPAGEQRLEWDGRDDRGRRVEAGTYTVRVQGPGIELSRALSLGR